MRVPRLDRFWGVCAVSVQNGHCGSSTWATVCWARLRSLSCGRLDVQRSRKDSQRTDCVCDVVIITLWKAAGERHEFDNVRPGSKSQSSR